MFQLRDLVGVIPGALLLGNPDIKWQNISIDSRTIKPGELFFAIRGEKYNGHKFSLEAVKKGASAVVLEKSFYQNEDFLKKDFSHPILMVDNTLLALQLWAHHYHSLFKPVNICITGSNGKTTTKEMIVHLLKSQYNVLHSQGNYNNEIGVPLTVFNLNSEHDVLVLEMAARKTGDIKELTKIVKPELAVITNVGEAHIGLFGNRDNIAREKSELILSLKDKGTAVLNHDDDYYEYLKKCLIHHNDLVTIGFHPESHLKAENVLQDMKETLHFDFFFQGEKYHVCLPIIGNFNIYNALSAFAVGIEMHIPIDEMVYQISKFKSPDMRMNCRYFNRGIIFVQDYYNANPMAVKEVLNSVARIPGGRFKAAVLGDMLELGEKAVDYHIEIGKTVEILSYDMLVTFGEYGKWIAYGAQKQGMPEDRISYFDIEDKDKIIDILRKNVPDNGIVLLKGSRGMKMEDITRHWKETEKNRGEI